MSINQGSSPLHSPEIQCILKVVVNTPLRRSFDYLPPQDYKLPLLPGQRVRVPFGKRILTGVITELAANSEIAENELKQVLEVLDPAPLFDETMLGFIKWAADYYHYPTGQVIHNSLPARVRQGKELKQTPLPAPPESLVDPGIAPSLNQQQIDAIKQVEDRSPHFNCFLLEGVTGSGKTEVYLQLIAGKLREGLQVLVLVPEISLTPQTLHRFTERFPEHHIAALHSGLTDKQRFEAWNQGRLGLADIIIGTRSAIFTPLARPGLIIVDEEHDASYKQHEGFRYSARDLAIYRARLFGHPVLLGSATPSLESLQNVQRGRFTLLTLDQRVATSSLPAYQCIDLKGKHLDEGFSDEALAIIGQHLERKSQVLIFLNRRGFAPLLQCHDCGWIAQCPRCDTAYTLHKSSPELRCHRCESQRHLMHSCPVCKSSALLPVGMGTERTEQKLSGSFPDVPVYRIDRDTTRSRDRLADTISQVNTGEPCILVGTQMLAKGHHFPRVTLVVVLDADAGLFSSDFRGQEFTGQLLIQVAGRAGRGQEPGEVLIQTHNSTHPVLMSLIRDGYKKFSRLLLEERRLAALPPYSHQVLIRAEASRRELPENFLLELKRASAHLLNTTLFVLGPLPAPVEKRAGRFRFQLLFQSSDRATLHGLLHQMIPVYENLPLSRKVRWSVDVDPLDFS